MSKLDGGLSHGIIGGGFCVQTRTWRASTHQHLQLMNRFNLSDGLDHAGGQTFTSQRPGRLASGGLCVSAARQALPETFNDT